ncbi:MAG: CHAD domain-containing protein [Lysobacterales bacterium]|jgi:CHAD domain-containing protein
MTFYLHKNEPIAPGLRRIAHEQIGNVLGALAHDAVPAEEKVHGLRTCCKKMRSLLRLARPVLGDTYKAQDKKFRKAAKHLAGHRDDEVVAKTIASLDGQAEKTRAPGLPVPLEVIERSESILRECETTVDGWPLDAGGFDDIVVGFAWTYQKCLDAWDAVQSEPSDDAFHKLRRFTKYHWYQVRILERLNKDAIRERRKSLHRLQLVLGDAHDIVLLQESFAALDDPDTQLLQRAIARKEELYAEATGLCEVLYEPSADELVADFTRRWAGGR